MTDLADLKKQLKGKNVAICGSGPSVKQFTTKMLEEDTIYIALNNAFTNDSIPFFGVVCADYTALSVQKEKMMEQKMVKIFGKALGPKECIIPDEILNRDDNISIDVGDVLDSPNFYGEFTKDLENKPVRFCQSVASVAMQIVLWAEPIKIYLVGLDFSDRGHFNEEIYDDKQKNSHKNWTQQLWTHDKIVSFWSRLKEFSKLNYPFVEIISVNPVSLKGIFKDIYIRGLAI